MGYMLSAKCACGYENSDLSEGHVASPGFPRTVIASCRQCRRLRSIDTDRLARGCRRCGAALELIELVERPVVDEEGVDQGYIDTDWTATYPCPACGKPELRFTLEGFFD